MTVKTTTKSSTMSINDTFFDAVKNNKLDVVKTLIAVKDSINLDINAKASDGRTALMLASDNGHKEIVELLLKNGADIEAKDSHGWTALMWASYHGRKEIVEFLLKKRGEAEPADINAKNSYGDTALLLASVKGHKEIVELLLNNNADIEAKDSVGWTALMWASERGHKEIVKILEAANATSAASAASAAKPKADSVVAPTTEQLPSYGLKPIDGAHKKTVVTVPIGTEVIYDSTATQVKVSFA
jgi:ankyrin repeat protein